MTTIRLNAATIHSGQDAQPQRPPRCAPCTARRARRLDSYGGDQPHAETDAKSAAPTSTFPSQTTASPSSVPSTRKR
jgi:hypothetical protein